MSTVSSEETIHHIFAIRKASDVYCMCQSLFKDEVSDDKIGIVTIRVNPHSNHPVVPADRPVLAITRDALDRFINKLIRTRDNFDSLVGEGTYFVDEDGERYKQPST